MEWQKLVSEGHVRAAQLRTAQPILIGIATALIIVGAIGVYAIAPPSMYGAITFGSAERAQENRQSIQRFMRIVPTPELSDAEENALAPAYEIERITEITLETLNQTGDLPELLPFKSINRRQFWSYNWDVETLSTTRRGDLILVGAILSDERDIDTQRAIEQPTRWIGLFRKTDAGEWVAYDLAFSGAFTQAPSTDIRPSEFPVTFNRLIPRRFLTEEEQQ